MKSFKRYTTALKHANGGPVIRVHKGREAVYIVGIDSLTSIDLIAGESDSNYTGRIRGTITACHLERLNNANHATPARAYEHKDIEGAIFPQFLKNRILD